MFRYLFVLLLITTSPAMAVDITGDISNVEFKSGSFKPDEYRSYLHISLINSDNNIGECKEYIWRRNSTIPSNKSSIGSKLLKSTVILKDVTKDDINKKCYFEGYEITETRNIGNIKPEGTRQKYFDRMKKFKEKEQGDELLGDVKALYMHRVRDVFIFHVENNDKFRNLCREGQVHANEQALIDGIPENLDPYMNVKIIDVFYKSEGLGLRDKKCYFSSIEKY